MGVWEDQYLPAMAMVLVQCIYAILNLLNKAALVEGMNPRVFVFYRQVIATLVTCPIAHFRRDNSNNSRMEIRIFLMIFATAFVGVTSYANLNTLGLYLASASISTAMYNLVPAITFVTAVFLRLEQMNVRRLSSILKILGTIICVAGAILMILLKGQKLINKQHLQVPSMFYLLSGDQNWLLGCAVLLASYTCWSLFLILQVPVTKCYPDHLSLSAWMCIISMFQTGAIAVVFERDPSAWKIKSMLELGACSYSAIFGSSVAYVIQSWCISRKGPVFAAMFTPVSTVVTTILAVIFLHEEVYINSLLGSLVVIVGLYVVLWGKVEENGEKPDATRNITTVTTEEEASCNGNLEQPLLINASHYYDRRVERALIPEISP